ncbi:RNA polymerase sigma-28 factor [bioreactor metagenome]|uniref:RNA polymerase sigma-28 factor n=1 Tax=bioreactor metagenome TaxID=1076179 RepID=A0A645IB79_9ZZZZ|nr:sigma-70 family RNA polymerase sigma factor [Candidatus Pelethousia sp.]
MRIGNEILMSLRAEKKLAGEVSFSDPIGVDKDGNEISLVEVLGTDTEEVQRQVELALFGVQIREAMDRALSCRERTVIELRYGLIGGQIMPQREIAKLLGISRSYVSRMEKKALAKLAKEFET